MLLVSGVQAAPLLVQTVELLSPAVRLLFSDSEFGCQQAVRSASKVFDEAETLTLVAYVLEVKLVADCALLLLNNAVFTFVIELKEPVLYAPTQDADGQIGEY